MKVLTFSRHFPKGHPKAGEHTFFVEQILNLTLPRGENGIVNRNDIKPEILPLINDFVLLDGRLKKHHTIRSGNRFKPGDKVSLRVWSDKPYRSKQIEFAQVVVKKVWDIYLQFYNGAFIKIVIGGNQRSAVVLAKLAANDGLELVDFANWFIIHPKQIEHGFTGQIICWNENIEY